MIYLTEKSLPGLSRIEVYPDSLVPSFVDPVFCVTKSLDKMIIESHYGKVVCCSGLDQGYNFKIVLSFSTG